MNIRVRALRAGWNQCAGLLLGVALAGCVTAPKVDWDSRLGSYTPSMALADYGQPTRSYKLSDGSQMLEWWQAGTPGAQVYSRPVTRESIYNDNAAGTTSPRLLQLTFGPDGTLVDWSRGN